MTHWLSGTVALLSMVVLVSMAYPSSPPTAQVWLTLPDESVLLEQQASVAFGSSGSGGGGSGITLSVDDSVQYQPIDGFGAALTDSSAYVLYQLKLANATMYNDTMRRLFGSSEVGGIGLNVIRLPSSASDFSLTNYTYDDVPNDVTLKYESIKHDQQYIIPVLRDMQALLGSSLKLVSTPWTPPPWMKTSNSVLQGNLIMSLVRTRYACACAESISKLTRAGYTSRSMCMRSTLPTT